MRHPDALPGRWDCFLFARGATVTHIYAFDRINQEWINPCNTIAVTARLVWDAPTRRLCKICERCTALLEPLPVRR